MPDSYTIPERTVKEIRIRGIHHFVRRDLRLALASVFEQVDVVTPSWPIPPGVMVADVEIQRFAAEADMATSGGHRAGRVYGQMGWAFAIRLPGERVYAFSYADSVTGSFGLISIEQTPEMLESTYRIALERLLAELTKREVLLRLDLPPTPPS